MKDFRDTGTVGGRERARVERKGTDIRHYLGRSSRKKKRRAGRHVSGKRGRKRRKLGTKRKRRMSGGGVGGSCLRAPKRNRRSS